MIKIHGIYTYIVIEKYFWMYNMACFSAFPLISNNTESLIIYVDTDANGVNWFLS
jgi:hypothetical protein